jgi:hypothetical protein
MAPQDAWAFLSGGYSGCLTTIGSEGLSIPKTISKALQAGMSAFRAEFRELI